MSDWFKGLAFSPGLRMVAAAGLAAIAPSQSADQLPFRRRDSKLAKHPSPGVRGQHNYLGVVHNDTGSGLPELYQHTEGGGSALVNTAGGIVSGFDLDYGNMDPTTRNKKRRRYIDGDVDIGDAPTLQANGDVTVPPYIAAHATQMMPGLDGRRLL